MEFRERVYFAVRTFSSNKASFSSPVSMTVDLYPPDRRKRDADNPIKALWDALQNAGAITDDSLVKTYTVTMREVVKGGRCEVRIESM